MAKTAVNQLQEQIEAIRREAFAAGFEAAMRAVRQFLSTQSPGTASQASEPARRRPAQRSRGAGASGQHGPGPETSRRAASGVRPQRGANARLVEEVLQANAPRALRPAEIRNAIQREKGVAIAFTSIRHALGQLEARQLVEQIADNNTWRHRAAGGGSAPEAAQ
jgi:hypothetical protein